MLFCFLAHPVQIWRGRRLSVALPLAVLTALVVILFFRVSDWENTRIRLRFQSQSKNLSHALEVNLNAYQQAIKAIERLYASSDNVTRTEFRVFTAATFREFPGIRALEWIPRVLDQDREAFEKTAREEGFADFQIREQAEHGDMIRAERMEEYFPVFYIEPLAGNENAIGFDLASNPTRKALLMKLVTAEK